ncbi:peptidase S49 [Lysobacteraceae bacterium NML91-0213]|nr:peptidase S49 [Xanthomonadaceae bacterium NML91-0213]
MKQSPGVLARLFGRARPAPVVSSLATAVLNRPLLAHQPMAEALIAGYLSGDVTSADTLLATERVPAAPAAEAETTGEIGVINISGGLVNRPMPGPSGAGPVSYTALREAFDELLADDGVTAIVLRIESPGGMASGLFDLTDHIFASRGAKPIHALVDDYAYSAAYAIAAACDEIWVSRTGGSGSIGVCAFHYDWSGANAQLGLQVTPIYAGARKIDFNPNFPLSDDAKADAQASVDDTYRLFVASVARYRGMDVDAVRATEANVFYGERAVSAGLATQLGTWDDLVAQLGAQGVDAPAQAGDADAVDDGSELGADATPPTAMAGDGAADAQQPDPDPENTDGNADTPAAEPAAPADTDASTAGESDADQLAAAGAIAKAVRAAGLAPDLAIAVMDRVTAVAALPAELERAKAVADLCRAAGLREMAADYVTAGTTIETVRQQLVAATASVGDEIVTAQPPVGVAAAAQAARQAEGLDPNKVYARRNTNNRSTT